MWEAAIKGPRWGARVCTSGVTVPGAGPFPNEVTCCHLSDCHHRGAWPGASPQCMQGETSGAAALPKVRI